MAPVSSSGANEPKVFVVSAPSGTGKTTLNRRLITEHPTAVEMSVSYTARPQRPGEREGVDYHYVTPDEFRAHVAAGDMLEWAEVFGKLYGTSLAEVRRIADLGRICLLEIDVQGWRQAHQKLPAARSVFILPPSIEALWQRLSGRGTEAPEIQWRRLRTARDEIEAGDLYDHFVVNDDFDRAYQELQSIIIKGQSGPMSADDGRRFCRRLLAEFDSAPWIQKLSRQFTDKT